MLKINVSYKTQDEVDGLLEALRPMGKIINVKGGKQGKGLYKNMHLEIDTTRKHYGKIKGAMWNMQTNVMSNTADKIPLN